MEEQRLHGDDKPHVALALSTSPTSRRALCRDVRVNSLTCESTLLFRSECSVDESDKSSRPVLFVVIDSSSAQPLGSRFAEPCIRQGRAAQTEGSPMLSVAVCRGMIEPEAGVAGPATGV